MSKLKNELNVEDKFYMLEDMAPEAIEALGIDQSKYLQFIAELEAYSKNEYEGINKAPKVEIEGEYGTAIIFSNNIEDTAIEQVGRIMDTAYIKNSVVRVMPDVHAGKGSVIGMTISNPPIVPNLIGVDIGCGITMAELGVLDQEPDLQELDKVIKKYIPTGANVHNKAIHGYKKKLNSLKCIDKLPNANIQRFEQSLGTLGGGNHFLELGRAEQTGSYYLIVHSGSRNLGHQVASYYQSVAIETLKDTVETKRKESVESLIEILEERDEKHLIEVGIDGISKYYKEFATIPEDLAFLSEEQAVDYLYDMKICQEYAQLNRRLILDLIVKKGFKKKLKDLEIVESVHNYIDFKDGIMRKGAISAKEGEPVIIPLNMRDGIIYGIGKGNPYWNFSAPHGAGRVMSRKKAKESISLEELQSSMKEANVFSTTLEGAIDEAPEAYKPTEEILNSLDETIVVIERIKPIYNYKG